MKLGVKRATEKELLDFTITRGDIPQNTIDAAFGQLGFRIRTHL